MYRVDVDVAIDVWDAGKKSGAAFESVALTYLLRLLLRRRSQVRRMCWRGLGWALFATKYSRTWCLKTELMIVLWCCEEDRTECWIKPVEMELTVYVKD